MPSVTHPSGRAPGTCLGSRGPRTPAVGSPCSPRNGQGSAAGRGARVPTAAPLPHAPAPASRSPARRHRQQQLRTPAPRPGGPRWRPQPRPLPASRAVPGLAGSAAHGAGSGGGNVNKSGFYSYLTLECRVHLLSARYQTPAAPSRVFTKAACASCVAEPSARAAALRRRRTRPAPAPCAAAPGPPERYASGAPGPLGLPAQPHPGRLSATPAAHPGRPAIRFADAPGVGRSRGTRGKRNSIYADCGVQKPRASFVPRKDEVGGVGGWGVGGSREASNACVERPWSPCTLVAEALAER